MDMTPFLPHRMPKIENLHMNDQNSQRGNKGFRAVLVSYTRTAKQSCAFHLPEADNSER